MRYLSFRVRVRVTNFPKLTTTNFREIGNFIAKNLGWELAHSGVSSIFLTSGTVRTKSTTSRTANPI